MLSSPSPLTPEIPESMAEHMQTALHAADDQQMQARIFAAINLLREEVRELRGELRQCLAGRTDRHV